MNDLTVRTGFSTIIFDCDSTLTSIEGIDELARFVGKEQAVSELTKRSMEGKIPIEEVFPKRLSLIAPTSFDLDNLGDLYKQSLVLDAKSTIEALQYLSKDVYIVSGGCKQAILPLADELSIPSNHVFAVDLDFSADGTYLGFDPSQPLTKTGGKQQVIQTISGSSDEKLLIGDGATDLEAKDSVGMFVGFGGVAHRKNVGKNSNYYIVGESLLPILFLATSDLEKNILLSTPYADLVPRSFQLTEETLRIK